MIKAVIFDLDGVLVSTDHYHYLAWKKMADQLHIPFDEKKNNELRGVSRMESLELILQQSHSDYSIEEKENLASEKNEIYRQSLQQLTKADLLPSVEKTLPLLAEKGIKLAIGSSSKNAPLILQQVGLTEQFTAIVDGNQIEKSKPHPEVFLKAGKQLGFDPHECLVVEDAVVGVEAAIQAGMKVAAMGDAKQHHLATYKIDTINELLDLLV
ncbi:beta-phosphoglucomutase [Bacillus sp. JJ722]|uniref:beta-phosphoglucomutase n=1 Tax=Bacillus sp. JJ722 TaxID=3122973 RepID=UPI002FFDA7BD